MTFQIGFLFALLAVMVYLFLTEKLPVDLTAFLGLLILVFSRCSSSAPRCSRPAWRTSSAAASTPSSARARPG
jgi:di/tricarboxylate transporter